jgi:hypothetical protein
VACIGEIKAIFWARGVENIYIEQPVEQYRVLESSEGYWIGQTTKYLHIYISSFMYLLHMYLHIFFYKKMKELSDPGG